MAIINEPGIDNGQFEVIEGGRDSVYNDEVKIKCFQSKLEDVAFLTVEELFSGFSTIKAITFSYDISFINNIMQYFEYGEIILGGNFLVQKDMKLNEFLAEIVTNAEEAPESIKCHPRLVKMITEGNLEARTPTFVLDHRKIYLLKSDDGTRTRVICTSANMSGRAWNGEQLEFYDFDDTQYAYEEYEKDFETAWANSEEIPSAMVTSKRTDDPKKDNPLLRKIKETGQTIVLQEPKIENELMIKRIQYTIDHEKMKEKNRTLLKDTGIKEKGGKVEIAPKQLEKIEHNYKKLLRKKMTVQQETEKYPEIVFNFEEESVRIAGAQADLSPSVEDIRNDTDRLLMIFENFNDFVGDTKRLQLTHFKLLNLLFSSPFHASLRCTARICGVPTSSLPLFAVAISEQANCGKTFMVMAVLKMMTGKNISPFNKENCNSEEIKKMQALVKGTPVFIDELDNKSLGYIKNIIKNPEKCEENDLKEMPMFIFASNECTEVEEPIRKRMVSLRFDGGLPSHIDQSAYKAKGDTLRRQLGTAFYREYLRRMITKVVEISDYMIHEKDRPNDYYPDIVAVSSETIISILWENGYEIPDYIKPLTWNGDYTGKDSIQTVIEEIWELYKQNRKAFTIGRETIKIELGTDSDSTRKGKTWKRTLPPEMEAKVISTAGSYILSIKRAEFEKRCGSKLRNGLFGRLGR